MKTLVNLFHPHLDKSTVHRSWAQRLAQEADITLRDLYALYPDGKIDVAAEQAALLAHDRLVFEHPFYWYSTPPLMKQWLDDVLTYGWAYGAGGNALSCVLRVTARNGRAALLTGDIAAVQELDLAARARQGRGACGIGRERNRVTASSSTPAA